MGGRRLDLTLYGEGGWAWELNMCSWAWERALGLCGGGRCQALVCLIQRLHVYIDFLKRGQKGDVKFYTSCLIFSSLSC